MGTFSIIDGRILQTQRFPALDLIPFAQAAEGSDGVTKTVQCLQTVSWARNYSILSSVISADEKSCSKWASVALRIVNQLHLSLRSRQL